MKPKQIIHILVRHAEDTARPHCRFHIHKVTKPAPNCSNIDCQNSGFSIEE